MSIGDCILIQDGALRMIWLLRSISSVSLVAASMVLLASVAQVILAVNTSV